VQIERSSQRGAALRLLVGILGKGAIFCLVAVQVTDKSSNKHSKGADAGGDPEHNKDVGGGAEAVHHCFQALPHELPGAVDDQERQLQEVHLRQVRPHPHADQ